MKLVKVIVTQDDIDNSTPGSETCALHSALTRVLDGKIKVGYLLVKQDNQVIGRLREEQGDFAWKFDHLDPVGRKLELAPFVFNLMVEESAKVKTP